LAKRYGELTSAPGWWVVDQINEECRKDIWEGDDAWIRAGMRSLRSALWFWEMETKKADLSPPLVVNLASASD